MVKEPRFKTIQLLLRLLAPYKWQVISLSSLISLSAALGTIGPQFIRIAFDTVIPNGELKGFIYLSLGFILFYIVRAGLGYAGMYLSYAFTQNIISDIRIRAYSRLLKLPVERFTKERSGSLVSRVVSDVNALEGMIQAGATRLMGQLFSILVVATILIAMNWQLALVNLVVMPLLAGITRYYQVPLRQASRKIRKRVGEMTAVASEAISNIQVVKVFANEPLEINNFAVENNNYVKLNLNRRKDVGMMESLITLAAEYGIGAILVIGGWLTVQGNLSLGELTAFLLYQRMLQTPVISVMFFNNQLQAGMAALERVADLLDAKEETEGEATLLPSSDIEFEVEFRNVSFTFPEAEAYALKEFSCCILQGQTVAFVGPSGAGKSTITKLISRLYDPSSGEILLGGQDIRKYKLAALRRAIAIVPQEPTLFSGSVKENIRYAKPSATDNDIIQAAELANAHEFIQLLPAGYDTEIGERGIKLSGGQKQRIAIARAILKEAKVLILDEATSALDSESETVIQDALEGLFAKRQRTTGNITTGNITSIVIAHRLSTIHNADKIIVLDAGQIVEEGTHQKLMANQGLYHHLYELQHKDNNHDNDR